MDDCYKQYVDGIDEMCNEKQKEIEEAYERYEATHQSDVQSEDDDFNATQTTKMTDMFTP